MKKYILIIFIFLLFFLNSCEKLKYFEVSLKDENYIIYENEDLDYNKFEFKLVYTNNVEKILDNYNLIKNTYDKNPIFDHFNSDDNGYKQLFNFSYYGVKSNDIEIITKRNIVNKVEIVNYGKQDYKYNENFDFTDYKIFVDFENTKDKTIDLTPDMVKLDNNKITPNEIGIFSLDVYYNGVKTDNPILLNVIKNDNVLKSDISINRENKKIVVEKIDNARYALSLSPSTNNLTWQDSNILELNSFITEDIFVFVQIKESKYYNESNIVSQLVKFKPENIQPILLEAKEDYLIFEANLDYDLVMIDDKNNIINSKIIYDEENNFYKVVNLLPNHNYRFGYSYKGINKVYDENIYPDYIKTLASENFITYESRQKYIYNNEDINFKYNINSKYNIEGLIVNIKYNNTFLKPHNVGIYNVQIINNFNDIIIEDTLEITKRDLTINIDNQKKDYYDLDPQLTFTTNNFVDDINLINIYREEGEEVGNYIITSNFTNDNYNIVINNGLFTINKKDIIATLDDKEITYKDEFTSTTYNFNIEPEFYSNHDSNFDITYKLITKYLDAGIYENNITATFSNPYYNVKVINSNLIINKRDININILDKEKTYGDNDPLLEYSIDKEEYLNELNITLTRQDNENVGKYEIVISNYNDKNFNLNITKGFLTIIKKPIEITINNVSKEYGNKVSEFINLFSWSTNDLEFNDTINQLNYEYIINKDDILGVGEYDINLDVTSNNYDIIKINKGTLKIIPLNVEITVIDKNYTKFYKDDDPLFEYETNTNFKLEGNLGRLEGENIGSYYLTEGTLNNENGRNKNFNIIYKNNPNSINLIINKAKLFVTANKITQIYKDDEKELTYEVKGLKFNDDLSVLSGELTRNLGYQVGSYLINQGTLSLNNDNYEIIFNGNYYEIIKRDLNVEFIKEGSFIYGETYNINITGDNLALNDYLILSEDNDYAGIHLRNIIVLDENNNDVTKNYNLNKSSYEFEVEKRKVEIIINDFSKTYGDSNPDFSFNIIFGSIIDEYEVTYIVSNQNVGSQTIDLATNLNLDNYDLTIITGTLTINKKDLYIKVDDKERSYGEDNYTINFSSTITGLVNNDTIDLNKLIYNTDATSDSPVGEYDITCSYLELDNYNVIYTNGILTIKPATIKIIMNNLEYTYDNTSKLIEKDSIVVKDPNDNILNDITLNIEYYYNYNLVEEPLNAGIYLVKIIFEGDDRYEAITKDINLTINKKIININYFIDGNSNLSNINYDGNEHLITVSSNDFITSDNVNIILNNNKFIDANTYNITSSIDNDNYLISDETKEFVFIINQTVTDITNLTIDDWTYGDTPSVPFAETNVGTINYLYSNEEDGNYTNNIPTNAGIYYVKAYITGNNNYTSASLIKSFNISKKKVNKPNKDETFYTYNGLEQTYQIKQSELYKIENNKKTNAGSYTVIVSLNDLTNYMWDDLTLDNLEYSFIINKKDNEFITDLTINDWTYGENPNNPNAESLSGTINYLYSNDNQNYSSNIPTNASKYYLKAFVLESDNYNYLEKIITFNILMKNIEVVWEVTSNNYGVIVDASANDNDYNIELIISNNDNKEVGTYLATASIKKELDLNNYNLTNITKEYSISKSYIIEEIDNQIKDYNSNNQEFDVSNLVNKGYSISNLTYNSTTNIPKDAGIYTVEFKLSKEGYYDLNVSRTFTINKIDLIITPNDLEKSYKEEEPQLTYSVSGLQENDVISGNLSRELGENAGSYEITLGDLTITNSNNYNIIFVEKYFIINKVNVNLINNNTYYYTGLEQTISFVIEGLLDDDVVVSIKVLNAGTKEYDTIISGTESINYNIPTKVTFTVNKATVNISSNFDKSNNYTTIEYDYKDYNDSNTFTVSKDQFDVKLNDIDVRNSFKLVFDRAKLDLSNGATSFIVNVTATDISGNLNDFCQKIVYKFKSVTIGDEDIYYTIEDAIIKGVNGYELLIKYNTIFTSLEDARLIYNYDSEIGYNLKSKIIVSYFENNEFVRTYYLDNSKGSSGYIERNIIPQVTLILSDDIILNLEDGSTIYINAHRRSFNTNTYGVITSDYYGVLKLEDNSIINLNNGSEFITYGFSTGTGVINAKQGSLVQEYLSILGYPGGTQTGYIKAYLSPISYFAPLTISNVVIFNVGSIYAGYTSLTAGNESYGGIGYIFGDENSLLEFTTGTIKKYLENDKVVLEADDSNINLIGKLKISVNSLDLDLNDKDIPLGTFYKIKIYNNTTFNINSKLMIISGSQLYIDQTSTLNINNNLYIDTLDEYYMLGDYRLSGNKGYNFPHEADSTLIKGIYYNSDTTINTKNGGIFIEGTINLNTNGKLGGYLSLETISKISGDTTPETNTFIVRRHQTNTIKDTEWEVYDLEVKLTSDISYYSKDNISNRYKKFKSGSSPFIYTEDENKTMYFEHHPLPFKLLKSVEGTTYGTLNLLQSQDGIYYIQIVEEGTSRTMVNNVELYAVDYIDDGTVIDLLYDIVGNPHTIRENLTPISLTDQYGNSYLDVLSKKDNNTMTFDDKTEELTYLTATFNRTNNNNYAKLMFSAQTSKYASSITEKIFESFNASNNLWWVDEAFMSEEKNINYLKNIFKAIGIRVEVWDGSNWITQANVEINNYLLENYLVYLDLSNIKTENLKVRLVFGSNVEYIIDHISIDFTNDLDMVVHKLNLETAVLNSSTDVKNELLNKNEYISLSYKENIRLGFTAPILQEGYKRGFGVATTGYVYAQNAKTDDELLEQIKEKTFDEIVNIIFNSNRTELINDISKVREFYNNILYIGSKNQEEILELLFNMNN